MRLQLIFGLFGLLCFPKIESILEKSQFFIKYPDQPIHSPNFTVASILLLETDDLAVNLEAASAAMTITCELEKYNTNNGEFPVTGTFNSMVFSLNSQKSFEQWSLLRQTIAQNLYYVNDTSKSLGVIQDTPMGAIINNGKLRNIFISASILGGSSLPSIFMSSSTSTLSAESFPIQANFDNDANSVVISQASSTVIAGNIFQVLNYYNWSFIAAIASSDSAGSIGQDAIQDLNFIYRNITFACYAILNPINSSAYQTDIDEFSSCFNSANVVRAIIVWMDPDDAIIATQDILKQVGSRDNLVFIYAGMTKALALTKVPVSSMYLEVALYSIPSDSPFSCTQIARNKFLELIGSEMVDMVTKEYGRCSITDSSLPLCDEVRSEEDTTLCTCRSDQVVNKVLVYIFF